MYVTCCILFYTVYTVCRYLVAVSFYSVCIYLPRLGERTLLFTLNIHVASQKIKNFTGTCSATFPGAYGTPDSIWRVAMPHGACNLPWLDCAWLHLSFWVSSCLLLTEDYSIRTPPSHLDTDSPQDLIQPRKVTHPVLESQRHQDLHRELVLSCKRWVKPAN